MDIKQTLITLKSKLSFSAALATCIALGFSLGLLRKLPSQSYINNTPIKVFNQQAKMDKSCPIKAKKKKNGKQLYHLPGDMFYNRIKPTICFKSEADAQKAGFIRSSR